MTHVLGMYIGTIRSPATSSHPPGTKYRYHVIGAIALSQYGGDVSDWRDYRHDALIGSARVASNIIRLRNINGTTACEIIVHIEYGTGYDDIVKTDTVMVYSHDSNGDSYVRCKY